jgi:ParB-like chromosome segregation protein Spo0J
MTTSDPRWIEYVPLDEVQPAQRNPKQHDHESLGQSFNRFGYVEPIVLDERTGRLVVGHGRLDQLRMLRRRKPSDVPPGIKDGWLVPIVRGWASADDNEADAYLVASNRLVETGGWDERQLVELLGDVRESEMGLLGTGYDDDSLLDMLAKVAKDADEDTRPRLEGLSFRVLIECEGEADQAALLERLLAEGLDARAITN